MAPASRGMRAYRYSAICYPWTHGLMPLCLVCGLYPWPCLNLAPIQVSLGKERKRAGHSIPSIASKSYHGRKGHGRSTNIHICSDVRVSCDSTPPSDLTQDVPRDAQQFGAVRFHGQPSQRGAHEGPAARDHRGSQAGTDPHGEAARPRVQVCRGVGGQPPACGPRTYQTV